MANSERPTYGQKVEHEGRPGEVRAIYPRGDGFGIVGRFTDGRGGTFVTPWPPGSEFQPVTVAK